MNHFYRSIWNRSTGTFVAVAEIARCAGKPASSGRQAGRGLALSVLAGAVLLALGVPAARALPNEGVVVAGSASLQAGPGSLTIQQHSPLAVINWQGFNIAAGETLRFVQPDSQAVALNRVQGAEPSSILGNLTANGKVFLVNPNGILFGKGASVDVGGLVASTLDLSNADFLSGRYRFAGVSEHAVLNQGRLQADGGHIALLGARVSNEGVIAARLGTVALAAGQAITLDVAGDGLLNVTVDRGAVQGLVQNSGLIQADGGQVLLTAQAAGGLLATVVNNGGVIQAQTLENHQGVIKLLGDLQAGTVQAGGTLDASAPRGGDGGFIETSAATVKLDPGVSVSTAAAQGRTGHWLIDPVDFNIAASGGDISGAQLSTLLGSNSVTIQTATGSNSATQLYGSAGSHGDILVNDTVSWSANLLTLKAWRNIDINTAMQGSGTAALALQYGQGAVAAGNTAAYKVSAAVNLPAGSNFSTQLGSDGATVNYTVITALGAAADATAAPAVMSLQGMAGAAALGGNYVLGSDITATATSSWNGGAGFKPIGSSGAQFVGRLDGLGHNIANLRAITTTDNVGLFGVVGSAGVISNLRMSGTTVSNGSRSNVGTLVGLNNGTITGVYSTTLNATGGRQVGGLVGTNQGSISLSATGTGSINSTFFSGGLVGYQNLTGAVKNSYAGISVRSSAHIGGVVGGMDGSSVIESCYSTGTVTGSTNKGGVLGYLGGGTVSSSFWNTTANPGLNVSTGGVGAGSSAGTSGLSATAMKSQANFVPQGSAAGQWDFDATWVLYAGSTYPLLRTFMSPLTVTANDATQTYSGVAYAGGAGVSYSSTPNMANVLGTLSFTGGGINVGSSSIVPAGLYSNQLGYLISYQPGTLTINKANLTLSGSRAYDGSTGFAGSALSAVGVAGETFSVLGAGDASNLASRNTQSNQALASLTGLSLGSSSNGGLSSNYNALGIGSSSVSVTAKSVTLTAPVVSKVYDGGLAYTAQAAELAALSSQLGVAGDTVTAATLAFTDKNVGVGNKSVSPSAATVSDGHGGANYLLSYAGNSSSTISAKAVTVSASKVYDGSTDLSGAVSLATGVVGESLGYSGASASDAHVATAGNYISALTLQNGSGGLASNYILPALNSASAPVSITPRPLTASLSTAGSLTKTYDGTTDVLASLSTSLGLSGLLDGDAASLRSSGGAYNDKNVGTANKVVLTGLAIAELSSTHGSAASDYHLDTVKLELAATITPRTVSVSASKVYDGSTDLTGAVRLATGVAGESLGYSGASASDAHVATVGKTITALTLQDGTGLASNYRLPTLGSADMPVTISPRTLSISASKVYDGSTDLAGAVSLVTGIAGESLGYSGASASDAHVATAGKYISALTLQDGRGGSASDYSLPMLNSANAPVSIAPKPLTASASIVGETVKTYDGSQAASGATLVGSVVGAIAADQLGLDVSGVSLAYNSPHVAQADRIVATGVPGLAILGSANGSQSSDYAFTAPALASVAGRINPATLTITADAVSRIYGGPAPAFSGTVSGFVNNENLATATSGVLAFSTSATAGSPVGTYAIVGAGLSAAQGNYSFVQAAGNATALRISKAPLTVTADDQLRDYGQSNPLLTAAISGFVNGEDAISAHVEGAPLLSTEATPATAVGRLPISVSGGSLSAANYEFSRFLPGVLTIRRSVAIDNTTAQAGVVAVAPVALRPLQPQGPAALPGLNLTIVDLGMRLELGAAPQDGDRPAD